MLSVLGALVLVYGGMVGLLYGFQRTLLYIPSKETVSPAAAGLPDMHLVELKTEDGLSLQAFFKPAAPGKKTLIHFHGNAGHIGYLGPKARPILDAGHGLLLVEYRGYGPNPGAPSEEGLIADGMAGLAFLDARSVAPRDILLWGESLGTGVAVALAARRAEAGKAAGGVILESPFTSIAETAQVHYWYTPAKWLVKDKFDSLSRIAGIGAPLLVIHGDKDDVVPIRFGETLFAAAPEPKKFVKIEGANHNDLFGRGLTGIILKFLDS